MGCNDELHCRLLSQLCVLYSSDYRFAAAANAGMDGNGTSAFVAYPLLTLLLQKRIHTHLANHPKILYRRFSHRILRSIPGFFLHYVLTGIIRTLVAIYVPILLPLLAKNNSTMFGAELRFILIWSIAARTWVFLDMGLRAYAAI